MTIINKSKAKHPLIFVHIPKCAGGSIKYFFNVNEFEDFNHRKLNACIEKFTNEGGHHYTNKQINNFFKFVSLRNPWDRLVSLYNFRIARCERQRKDYWRKIKESNLDFKDWIVYLKQEPEINKEILFNYIDYISLEGKINIDFIINFHNFNQDFKFIKILKTFKNIKASLTHEPSKKHYLHKSYSKDYRSYYDSKAIEIVAEIHKRDIDLFGYDFYDYKKANYEPFRDYKKILDIINRNVDTVD